MRVLTNPEKNEFNKTYDFLNYFVGSVYTQNRETASIYDIRYDDKPPPAPLIEFCNALDRVYEIEELGYKFGKMTSLKKISILFNETSRDHKEKVMQRLVNYCFRKKVQPKDMRVEVHKNFKFEVNRKEAPLVSVYESREEQS